MKKGCFFILSLLCFIGVNEIFSAQESLIRDLNSQLENAIDIFSEELNSPSPNFDLCFSTLLRFLTILNATGLKLSTTAARLLIEKINEVGETVEGENNLPVLRTYIILIQALTVNINNSPENITNTLTVVLPQN